MTKLNKIRLTMAGLLCGGLLIVGIGAGVGFGELSKFTYAGEKPLSDSTTKYYSTEVELFHDQSQVYVRLPFDLTDSNTTQLSVSESVAPGTVRIDAAYRSSISTPQLYHNDYNNGTGEPLEESLYLRSSGSPVALLFAYKDELLKDLRAHQLGDYHEFEFTDLSVTVNPADQDRIFLQ